MTAHNCGGVVQATVAAGMRWQRAECHCAAEIVFILLVFLRTVNVTVTFSTALFTCKRNMHKRTLYISYEQVIRKLYISYKQPGLQWDELCNSCNIEIKQLQHRDKTWQS